MVSPNGPRGGSSFAFGFGTRDDPYMDLLAAEGDLRVDPIPVVVQAVPGNIPALSEWGIIITKLLLTSAGTIILTPCPTQRCGSKHDDGQLNG